MLSSWLDQVLDDSAVAERGTGFPVEEGVLRAFVPHERAAADVTDDMQSFYMDHPFPNYEDIDDLGTLVDKSRQRGFALLLDRAVSPHADVLEVGCGTGQLGNFLSLSSRRVLSCDLCLNSLRLAERFRAANGLSNVQFAQMNLFRLPLRPERFDVVICTGVLHHTSDPRGGFEGLVPLVRPGGWVVIGLYNRIGRLQTRLRRRLFALTGERFANLDPYVRKYRLAGDKRRAWLMDQYHNPHESLHTIDQVLGWFDAAGLEFVRSFPSCIFGADDELDYERSIFTPETKASRTDRLLAQWQQAVRDDEGGLFLMIGRKPEATAT